MSKTLLLLVQSRTLDTYVNVVAHCVKNEQVENIVFIGREGLLEEQTELDDLILNIYKRIKELAKEESIYQTVAQTLPPEEKITEKVERIDFLRPHLSIQKLKKKFDKPDQVIIDITATSAQVSSNVLAACLSDGFEHICHFALDDKVYKPEWSKSGKSRLYHDLIDKSKKYYNYADFSKSETIKQSFDKLRSRGMLVRWLLLISCFLAITVVVSLSINQNNVAQFAAIGSSVTVLIGLLEALTNLSKRIQDLFV